MSKSMPELLDVVALTIDLPEYNLLSGQVGTIVELLADGAAFEVEFSDSNGQTYESVGWEHLKFVRTDELADRGENQRK
jgi:hypothetical protein